MSYKNKAFIFFVAIIVSQASMHGMEWREEYKLGKHTKQIGSFVCSHCRFETTNSQVYQIHRRIEHRDNSTPNVSSDWRNRLPQLTQPTESTSAINHVHFEPTVTSEIVLKIEQPTEEIFTASQVSFNEQPKAIEKVVEKAKTKQVIFLGDECFYCGTKEYNLNRHIRASHGSSVPYEKRFLSSVTADNRLAGGKIRLHNGK